MISENNIRLGMLLVLALTLSACSTRHLQDSLDGSTAQRLVTHSIDDLVSKLPEAPFEALRNQKLLFHSHFLLENQLKAYADERIKLELQNRFGIDTVEESEPGIHVLSIFYTSLATDRDNFGITIPLSGIEGASHINVISLEKFHGVSEMYYFLGQAGAQTRHKTLQAIVKTDALGLPFITIPISNIDRAD